MPDKKIELFDTTLRDGTQGERVSFSVEDKIHIAQRLDDFSMDFIEGGWPGSNPRDINFFKSTKSKSFKHAKIVAFGSTRHKSNRADSDPNLKAMLEAETPAVSIFGKSWLLHVETALKVDPEENLKMIEESVGFIRSEGRDVIYDAEHFFDGYKSNSDYAIKTLAAAERGGAYVLVLCDTNGGSSPFEIADIVATVKKKLSTPLGIHTHNDSGLAVANTLYAVENGAVHVQGTVNGYGERCGNANLCTIIPNLQLKMGYKCVSEKKMAKLTSLSRYVSEIANITPARNLPFVGKSAFAHKGGIHVSGVMRDSRTYEHIEPETVGNERRVLVSDLSGKSNIQFKSGELGIDLSKHQDKIPKIIEHLKELEHAGYSYEAAEGSLELLVRQITGEWRKFFELCGFRILVEKDESGEPRSEATIRIKVDGIPEHVAAEGNGPVHALDCALRKTLINFYPEIQNMSLFDYKVRVLNQKSGTQSIVRVLIEFKADTLSWSTVGVSENIIEASWQALTDGYSYFLLKNKDIHYTRKVGKKQKNKEVH